MNLRRFLVINQSGGAPAFASVITPTLGAEIVNNPGFEAPYTAGLAASWTNIGTPTLAEENTIIHGGASSQKISAAIAVNDGVYKFYQTSLTAGQWVRMSVWGYEESGAFAVDLQLNGDTKLLPVSGAAWQQLIRTGKFIANGTGFWGQQVGASATVGYMDDASIKVINTPSMFGACRYTTTTGDVQIRTKVKVTSNTQIGCWLNVDDPDNPTNGVVVCIDGAKAWIYKLVNGTWSTVLNGLACVWADYDELMVAKVGTQYWIYKNDFQIYADPFTISDASIVDNVNHVQFSTYEDNAFSSFDVTDIAGTVLKKVTTIGDSITAGVTTQDWPMYFRALYNYGAVTLINRAVSGADILATGSFEAQVAAAASDDADRIIITLGTNDVTEVGVQTKYTNQINALKASNVDAEIYCTGILPCTSGNAYTAGKVAAINAAIQAAAAATGETYKDATGWIDPATDTIGDGLHPSDAGAYKIAQRQAA